jgi:hypothetical protein
VHRRRFPALQFCHSERVGRYSLYAQTEGEPEPWLQERDGQGSCAAIKEGCRSIAETRRCTPAAVRCQINQSGAIMPVTILGAIYRHFLKAALVGIATTRAVRR